jgi:AraC-like DNA-binding protein
MYKRVIVLLFLAVQCCMVMTGQSSSDSIRRLLPHLHGQARLDAMSNLCDIACAQNSESEELKCDRALFAEACRQHNLEEAVFALGKEAYCLYNYNDEKRLKARLPFILEYMKRHKDFNNYYEMWSLIPTCYLMSGKMQQAMSEAKKMYADARRRGNSFGLGVAENIMGMAYIALDNKKESVKAFAQSIPLLKKGDDVSLLLDTYSYYCIALYGCENYHKMAAVTVEWKAVLDSMSTCYKKKGLDMSVFLSRYKYCYISMAEVAMMTGHLEQAEKYLHKAEMLARGGKSLGETTLWKDMTKYHTLKKDYNKAMYYCRKWLASLKEAGDSSGYMAAEEEKAKLLVAMGRGSEAASIYQKLFVWKDSVFNIQASNQLNELNTIYKVDELKSAKETIRANFVKVVSACIVLLLILALYIMHLRRLRIKHRAIYENLKAEMEREKARETEQIQISEDELSDDELLYRRVCELMDDKELFKNADLNRDDIASELGTNSKYVATAIRKCAYGISVAEFLNDRRLLYSVKLLKERPELTIAVIGDMSGFKSRTSFYRFFRDKYSLSPSDYRKNIHVKR